MNEQHLQQLRMFAPIAGLLTIWSIESLRAGWTLKQRLRHAGRHLILWGINTIVVLIILSGFTVAIVHWADAKQTGLLRWLLPVGPVRTAATIVLLDLWMWLWHLLNHVLPWFWRFHRVHHSDVDMDVTTSFRFHIGEIASSAICRLPVIVLLGVEMPALLLHETLLVLMTQFHHSTLRLGRWDHWLQKLVVTPGMHRVHHSPVREQTNSNYSSFLTIWDRLFFTFSASSDTAQQPPLGLNEFRSDEWQSVSGMLRTPFVSGQTNKPDAQGFSSEQPQ